MSIVSNLFVNIGTFMNERFAFAASLGACLIMGLLIRFLSNKLSGPVKYLPLAVLSALFIYKSYSRIPAWKNPMTLNQAGVKVSQNSARANSFMATALFNMYKEETDQSRKINLLNQAQPYAIKAVKVHPRYYNGNLMKAGVAAEKYKYDNNIDAVLSQFLEVLGARPDVDYVYTYMEYLNGRTDRNKLLNFYKRAGESLLKISRPGYCVKYMKLAQTIFPSDPTINNLASQAYQQAQKTKR